MKDSLKGSMINIQDFHLQGSFKPSHFYPFNCPVLTPDDYTVFKVKVQRLKPQNFHTKLPCQKPVLRQIEWGVQKGPITKNRVLPVTTLFF